MDQTTCTRCRQQPVAVLVNGEEMCWECAPFDPPGGRQLGLADRAEVEELGE